MSRPENICPTCGKEMTSVVKNKRQIYVCEKCEADPFTSGKVDKLVSARGLQPPRASD